MGTSEIIDKNSKYVMNSYGRIPVAFEKGEGTKYGMLKEMNILIL